MTRNKFLKLERSFSKKRGNKDFREPRGGGPDFFQKAPLQPRHSRNKSAILWSF